MAVLDNNHNNLRDLRPLHARDLPQLIRILDRTAPGEDLPAALAAAGIELPGPEAGRLPIASQKVNGGSQCNPTIKYEREKSPQSRRNLGTA